MRNAADHTLPQTVKSSKPKLRPKIGAHCKGGLKGAVEQALAIGAQSMQIFIGSPQTWRSPTPAIDELENFKRDVKKHKLGPVFVHGNYLVNLASSSRENLQKSVLNLHTALRLSDMAGAEGLIFHPGSVGQDSFSDGMVRFLAALSVVLKDYNGNCRLLMEVCAGQGKTIGDKFSDLSSILEDMNFDERLGVCWDTCHLFNAGYDVSTEAGLEKTIDEFEKLIGFKWLAAVHANDSKTPFASRKDRHENIGCGYIGEEAFARMLHQKELRHLPWILEVPGFEDKGPDKENIQILHRLAS